MMSRITRKLYLSTKVTAAMRDMHGKEEREESVSSNNDDGGPNLSSNELLNLLRTGTGAIRRLEDANTAFEKVNALDWQGIVDRSQQISAERNIKGEETPMTREEQLSAEKELLESLKNVNSRSFEGDQHHEHKATAEEQAKGT